MSREYTLGDVRDWMDNSYMYLSNEDPELVFVLLDGGLEPLDVRFSLEKLVDEMIDSSQSDADIDRLAEMGRRFARLARALARTAKDMEELP